MATRLEQPQRAQQPIPILVDKNGSCPPRLPLPATSASPVWSSCPAQGVVTTPFSSWHPGIDIGILRSLEVRAARPGTVIAVGEPRGFEGYGNVVEIADGRGFTSLYAHLAGWRVRVGQRVREGQRIGTAGCTGWCTGTHLHFEMRLRGRPVDPLRFASPNWRRRTTR